MPATARQLTVHLLPELAPSERLAGAAVAVIDVLRATTTIVHAIAAGATRVIPCLEVADALRIASKLPAGSVILGGERGGRAIDGFDLGNSPLEFTTDKVGDKTVVFTTTNGTRALLQCQSARRVLVAAFVNVTAVIKGLEGETDVHLVCAGIKGQVTLDDVLLAGWIAQGLQARWALAGGGQPSLNDSAALALAAFARLPEDVRAFALRPALGAGSSDRSGAAAAIGRLLCTSLGGRNLISLGMQADVRASAQFDRFAILPALDPSRMEITVA